MNRAKLQKSISTHVVHVSLQPLAIRLDERGNELATLNDDWRIVRVTDEIVEIRNIHTDHSIELGTDHVHHFDTNPGRSAPGVKYGFLTLTVQLFIQGHAIHLRPTQPGQRVSIDGRTEQDRAARALLLDERLARVSADYMVRGSPAPMIDTFDDLSRDEKAILYDRAVRLKKGRPPKHNPYTE